MKNNNQVGDDILAMLVRFKWVIIVCMGLSAAVSVFYAVSLPNIYRSDATLAPAAKGDVNAALSSVNAQFGGLASLAGINTASGRVDDTTLAVESLRSRRFLMEFIEKHKLKVPLFAAVDWDATTNQLVLDAEVYDENTKTWKREVSYPFEPEPSLQEAFVVMSEMLLIEQDKNTGLFTISIDFYSPQMASDWLTWMIADLNSYIREKDLIDARTNIEFLEQQAEKTNLVGMRDVIYQLIEEQLKTVMLAEVSEQYAFFYIDPPLVPELKYAPKRAIICIVGTFLGTLLGCVIAVLLGIRRSSNR